MPQTTMTVRLSGELSDFVTNNVDENGSYENISEYVRSLIRNDKSRFEKEAFERLKAELTLAFSTPDSSYSVLSAEDIFSRNN
ncbi:MAG: addiction module antitoxin [Candidatus Ruthia sp.]|jgi:putative addiction module CopG family antidote|nr:addiction module antitoxin [Candidatus Ruthturnera sp.]